MKRGINGDRKTPTGAGMALLTALLVSLLIFPNTPVLRAEGGAVPGFPEVPTDPLGRLPETPQEAHQRLEDNEVGWPPLEDGEGDVDAAYVRTGLRIAIPYDYVEGFTSHANAGVRVELWRGGSNIYTINTTTNESKWFYADFHNESQDIRSGDEIQVTDLAGGVTVTVNCTLTGNVNISNEMVTGNAPSGNRIDVYLKTPNTYYGDIPPGVGHKQVNATGGNYSATFNSINIRNGDVAYIFSTDPDNENVVMNTGRTAPVLAVYPQYDEVMGFFKPDENVVIKAGSATSPPMGTAGDGFFDALFTDHDIVPGEEVSSNSFGTPRSIIVGDIWATADPITDEVKGTAPPNRTMRIVMNTYREPVMVELRSDAVGAYSYDFTGLYDISGIEVYNVSWYNDAGDCVVYEFQTYSWFMPEGYTGQGFDTWILIMNPNEDAAMARVVFQTGTGPVAGPLLTLPRGSRVNVHVNDWLPVGTHVSTMVTAIDGSFIMSERAMYMYGTPDGKWGAHDSIGILTPSPEWYLPEGATLPGFDEWVLVQNPNNVPVQARVQFLEAGGVAGELLIDIGANSRYTVHVNFSFPNREVSTFVESLTTVKGERLPVFAERAMYMNTPDGKIGAHDSIGIATAAPEWYLPEGTTLPGFDEWVLVMNPNDFPTNVKVSFLTPGGVGGTHEMYMLPHSRGTVHVNVYLPNQEISTVVTSLEGAGIMAERAMYMDTPDGKIGAHDSIGSYQTNTYWYLPEGTTLPGFDEWVLIQNPNNAELEVRVTLLSQTGPVAQRSLTMLPESRQTVHVNELVDDVDVSAVVECINTNLGVLAERAMYMWTTDNKQGSHDSIGIPAF
jgi:hypothetical protein